MNNDAGINKGRSVAVIDPVSGLVIKDIILGLHPNEIISDKKGRFVYVTNSNSDNVSVINTFTDNVTVDNKREASTRNKSIFR